MWFMFKMMQHNNTLNLKQGKAKFFLIYVLHKQSADAQNDFEQNSRQILKKTEK